jgi:FixJ family two-component response regulator
MKADVMPSQSDETPLVFVVDDDADVRGGLEALFQSVGLSSEAFASTKEFLQRKLPDKTSCLILDVRLRGLSGLDFQTELVKTNINMPIIFLTGHGNIPMAVKALKAGAVQFLTKPVREQDLLDAVHVALNLHRARREEDKKNQDLHAQFNELSHREQTIMAMVTAGLKNMQIAGEIGLSEGTIKAHRRNAMKRLGATSFAEFVRMADSLGIHRTK